MRIDFDQMPDSARLWIYQADKQLSEQESNTISAILSAFTQQWMAHGQPLSSGFKIVYDRFVVLAVDESFNGASGCSIDGSTRIVKKIEDTLGIKMMDRTLVAFLQDDQVFTLKISELPQSLQKGEWNKDTMTFNNLVPTKGQLDNDWIIPAERTWLKKYLTKVTAF